MTLLSKKELRLLAREQRAKVAVPDFAQRIAAHASALKIPPGAVVSGYHAFGDEADPGLLLQRLAERGHAIAFPRVVAKAAPLEFHLIPEGGVKAVSSFGVHEPLPDWPRVTPDVLLVPLLAYDAQGTRLGYGGGFYDRTLARLKPGARAIGIAYAGQKMDFLPRHAHDYPLDFLLTELGLSAFPS